MSDVTFERLFTMSAFEALRVLRRFQRSYPDLSPSELGSLAKKINLGWSSLDIEAGQALARFVQEEDQDIDGAVFYKTCIEVLILSERQIWARTLTLGRGKFVQKLSRDEQQCFREAGLLLDPPTEQVVAWWDRLTAKIRQSSDERKLEQARFAERLSLQRESERLRSLGIDLPPKWVAIEDNTAGYLCLVRERIADLMCHDCCAWHQIWLLREEKNGFEVQINRNYGKLHDQPLPERYWQTRHRRIRWSKTVIRAVFAKGGGKCRHCGWKLRFDLYALQWQIDHDIPLARQGSNDLGNLWPACKGCNASKGQCTSEEFKAGICYQRGSELWD